MKKLLGILVLGLLLSGSAFAKTIYCFKPDEVGVFDLESSQSMLFFEIEDRSKKVKWLKDYYLTEFEYYQGSNSTSKKIFKFNKNEILLYEDLKFEDEIHRHYFELDRISGLLLLTFGIEVDSEGNEISEDQKGTIYKRGDEKFNENIIIEKYFCDNHKGL